MEKNMRLAFHGLSITAALLLAVPLHLHGQPMPLVRVQNRSNPLLGWWVSTDLSQSSAINAKRAELIFASDYTETSITYLKDGRVSRRVYRYGIEHVELPDEGYVWLFGSRDGLETKTRYEFRLINGQLS
jgi:hypothetical protein